MKLRLLSIGMFVHCICVAQREISVRPLMVGEMVPDIRLGEIYNTDFKNAKFSDFKGKLVILDFWSTYCSICIRQFPELEALQRKFGDKLYILSVGFDGNQPGSVESFIKKNIGTRYQLNLPTAIQKAEDTLLQTLFPFDGLPHEVWIDGNGRLIGITDHTAITELNISRILAGEQLFFDTQTSGRKLEVSKSFLLYRGKVGGSVYGSAFARYIDSLKPTSSVKIIRDSSESRLLGINQSLIWLYRNALGRQHNFLMRDSKNKRIILDTIVRRRFKDWADFEHSDNWEMQTFFEGHLYCYELVLPSNVPDEYLLKKMVGDLDEYFGVHSKVERQEVLCYRLVRMSSKAKFVSAGSMEYTSYSFDQLSVNLRNSSMANLISFIDNFIPHLPIIDKTNYDGLVDIDLDLRKAKSVSDINSALKKYDLQLIPGEEILEVLHIASAQ